VLMTYGDGAVMGVPAHDERDFAFAKKYGLPIKQVVAVAGESFSTDAWQEWYGDKQRGTCIESGVLDGFGMKEAVGRVAELVGAAGLGEKKTTWRLRDWGISRQRYWGTPIPIIHCDDCGVVPVPEKDLPVVLPEDLIPDGSGNPLNKHAAFLNVGCPKCGKPARRETDTMDTFVDSSWYFMRYCDPNNDQKMVAEGTDYWMPMDQYIGGIEHAILHLLYARFITRTLHDMGLVSFEEPFTRLFNQGVITKEGFKDKHGSWVSPQEVRWEGETPYRGDEPLTSEVTKMSKSRLNVVPPDELIARYGADTERVYTLFIAPPEKEAAWSDEGVVGASRFLNRVWNMGEQILAMGGAGSESAALTRKTHQTIDAVTRRFDRFEFNTAISGLMELSNAIGDALAENANASSSYIALLKLLHPFAPHITEELWTVLGESRSIFDSGWPSYDEALVVEDRVTMAVQVNGKTRGTITLSKTAPQDEAVAAAIAEANVAKFVTGEIRRVIFVPGRMLNLVV
jgi:leucyl-tRNA synthetase